MSRVCGHQGFQSFASQVCVTAKPGNDVSKGAQKYSEIGTTIMLSPSHNRLGKHNYESLASRDFTRSNGLSNPHNNARTQDFSQNKPFIARTTHQVDYTNSVMKYDCYTSVSIDDWKVIFERVSESCGRLPYKSGSVLRVVKEGLSSKYFCNEASLPADSTLIRHIAELYQDFFTRHPNLIQQSEISWEAFSEATKHINEFLKHDGKQQARKEGFPQTALSSAASSSSYQLDYGKYGEKPSERPYTRRRGMDSTTNDLNSGTPKSTYHIPGYGGFMPHGTRNHTAMAHAEAEQSRTSVESSRICCKENLPGYTGHQPTDSSNYRGVSLAGSDQNTTNGYYYRAHFPIEGGSD